MKIRIKIKNPNNRRFWLLRTYDRNDGLSKEDWGFPCDKNLTHISFARSPIEWNICNCLTTSLVTQVCRPPMDVFNSMVLGAKALARMIRKNETVEMLSLSCNNLTDKGLTLEPQ